MGLGWGLGLGFVSSAHNRLYLKARWMGCEGLTLTLTLTLTLSLTLTLNLTLTFTLTQTLDGF